MELMQPVSRNSKDNGVTKDLMLKVHQYGGDNVTRIRPTLLIGYISQFKGCRLLIKLNVVRTD